MLKNQSGRPKAGRLVILFTHKYKVIYFPYVIFYVKTCTQDTPYVIYTTIILYNFKCLFTIKYMSDQFISPKLYCVYLLPFHRIFKHISFKLLQLILKGLRIWLEDVLELNIDHMWTPENVDFEV